MADRPSEGSQVYHEQGALKDYTVKPGDSLSKIAAAHKMSLKDFIALQGPGFDPKKILKIGTSLKTPEIHTVNIPNLETIARQQQLAKKMASEGKNNQAGLTEQMLAQWDVGLIIPLETDNSINIASAPSISKVKEFDSQFAIAKMPLEMDQRVPNPEALKSGNTQQNIDSKTTQRYIPENFFDSNFGTRISNSFIRGIPKEDIPAIQKAITYGINNGIVTDGGVNETIRTYFGSNIQSSNVQILAGGFQGIGFQIGERNGVLGYNPNTGKWGIRNEAPTRNA